MPAAEWPLFLPIGMEVWGHFKTLSNTLKNHCWSFGSNCSPIFGAEAKTRSDSPSNSPHLCPSVSGGHSLVWKNSIEKKRSKHSLQSLSSEIQRNILSKPISFQLWRERRKRGRKNKTARGCGEDNLIPYGNNGHNIDRTFSALRLLAKSAHHWRRASENSAVEGPYVPAVWLLWLSLTWLLSVSPCYANHLVSQLSGASSHCACRE